MFDANTPLSPKTPNSSGEISNQKIYLFFSIKERYINNGKWKMGKGEGLWKDHLRKEMRSQIIGVSNQKI